MTATLSLPRVPDGLLIGSGWRPASGGATLDVHDPATGDTIAQVADGTVEDAVAALDAACAAQASWAATDPRERAELLRDAYTRLIARKDDFARLITAEMGKPLAEAAGEVVYGAEFFRWFSEEAVRMRGSFVQAPLGGSRLLTLKQPVGPTLMITPWNFPLAMGTRKIGPAIAAGCTMVVKPAAETPLTMLALAELLRECGLPDGVLNVVTTTDSSGTMAAVMRDPRLRKVTFTGSTGVGKKLLAQASENVLRTSMELGGNAPFIVFPDADIDAAVEGAMLAKMRNIGEACTAANRFYVHADVADSFTAKFAARMSALRVGPGLEESSQVGSLITRKARDGVQELVDDAVAKGARVVCGGGPVGDAGSFYAPTVLSHVTDDAALTQEEIFGPVAAVLTFTDEADVVRRANDTVYGLVAYVFTRDVSRALRMAEALEYGMVGVNQGVVSNPAAPFGGVKQSGVGREGGAEGIEEYLETKYVGIAP